MAHIDIAKLVQEFEQLHPTEIPLQMSVSVINISIYSQAKKDWIMQRMHAMASEDEQPAKGKGRKGKRGDG